MYKNTENGYELIRCSSGKNTINIKQGTTIISKYAFDSCDKLKKVVIPESVVLVKKRAFSGCYKLSDVTFLSDSVEIEDDAFDSDYELNELKFPSSTRKLKWCINNQWELVYDYILLNDYFVT